MMGEDGRIDLKSNYGGLRKQIVKGTDKGIITHTSKYQVHVQCCADMVMMMRMVVVLMVAISVMQFHGNALNIAEMRRFVARNNVTCILVFGDSSVDPGNNNHLDTTVKSNFLPYGKDFFHGQPTGRFTNGRLPTDFIAEELGLMPIIPAFLDPTLRRKDIVHGVSFASAASGYDDLTANLTNVLAISKQIEYLRHYKIHLRGLVGRVKSEEIVSDAIFVVSTVTNDFIQNYFLEPTRAKQFSLRRYINYLIACMSADIKEMHRLGGRRFAVVGSPPLGCMPIVRTLVGQTDCVESYNRAAISFNAMLKAKLATFKETLGVRAAYVDAYGTLMNATRNPQELGFKVTSRGCCGTGMVEFGDSCKGQSTCKDASAYVYWDAVHPTERMYKLIANQAIQSVLEEILD